VINVAVGAFQGGAAVATVRRRPDRGGGLAASSVPLVRSGGMVGVLGMKRITATTALVLVFWALTATGTRAGAELPPRCETGENPMRGTVAVAALASALKALSRYREAMSKSGAMANAEDRTVMKQLGDELEQLVKERDRVAHDAWFIGLGSSETTDWSSGQRWRYRSGAEWTPVDVRALTAESIERLADDADRLRRFVGNVAGAVLTLPYHPGEGPAHVLKIVDGRLAMNR
jgi:hypothetical protein